MMDTGAYSNSEPSQNNEEIENTNQDLGITTDLDPNIGTTISRNSFSVELEEQSIKANNSKEFVKKCKEHPSNEHGSRFNSDDDNSLKVNLTKSSFGRKKVARIYSDSEDDDIITPHNNSFNDTHYDKENEAVVYPKTSKVVASEDDFSHLKSKLAALCDSDSEEELYNASQHTQAYPIDNELIEQNQHENKKKSARVQKKSKSQTKNNDEPKAMTPKEAAEQRIEIQSESQRMLRERNISLPYHKPKKHSLKEFLARRPKFASAVPITGRAPPSVAIKMSAEQLELVSKQLKMRQKEVKEFYKSESESDDEDRNDKEYLPPGEEEKEVQHTEEQKQFNENDNSEKMENDKVIVEESGNLEICDEMDVSREQGSNCDETVAQTKENIAEPNRIESKDDDEKTKENIVNSEEPTTENDAVQTSSNSESYNFNLDDVLQSPEKDTAIPRESLTKPVEKQSSKTFTYTDLDKEIEAFGEDPEEQEDDEMLPHIKAMKDIINEKLARMLPKLSGDPNHVIDLDSGLTKPKEVIQLMERFAKHTSKIKHYPKHKIELSIVTVESGGDVHKETVSMNISDEEDTIPEEKPGARLQRLKEYLQNQMAQRKSEIWQQKAAKGIRSNRDPENTDGSPDEKDILDDEDEEESDLTDEEDYSDEEFIDEELKKKHPKLFAFLDKEAEVSDNDDEEETGTKEGYEDSVPDGDETSCSEESSNMSSALSASEEQPASRGDWKRIVKRMVELGDDSDGNLALDSDSDDLFQDLALVQKVLNNEQLDSTVTADEDDLIPPHQPRQLKTPIKALVSQSKSIADFLTPISFLTSIQNLASASKSKDNTPFRVPASISATEGDCPQKKLFSESEHLSSQALQDSESGQSVESTSASMSSSHSQGSPTEEPPNTQDLLGICSGEFTGVTQLEPNSLSVVTCESQEIKTLGSDQDMIISQLIDEEELENFKKNFDSPVVTAPQRVTVEAQEITGGGVIDSDDDNPDDDLPRKKRNNKRKIQFSDDEDSGDDSQNDGEKIDLHDEDNEEAGEDDVDNIGYDSEENEVQINQEHGMGEKKQKMRLADFLEAEAELSESEWGSEDEDEKGLDDLEFELGDTEKFDEDKMKEDLEKIHMRRILDDDTREVKMLQELLLDDGELHGTGRQRQFKWKNIDQSDDASEERKHDDEIYMEEEESEEQWRKRRHEREMFLKEKQKKCIEEQDDLCNQSQLLKIGRKVLERSESQTSSQNATPSEKSDVDLENNVSKTPFSLLTKRGSFLSRGDQVLQRVAEYTKVNSENTVGSSKTTKNFVFQSVSTLDVSVANAENKKRRASEGTPNVLKKLRLDSTFSPAVKKKSDKSQRSKKLFNF